MHLGIKSPQRISRNLRKPVKSAAPQDSNKYAIEEITAYIAVRDGLLEEAAQETTEATIERLVLTNTFVASCLRPARPLYLAQCLPEVDTVRELKRCHAVDAQIIKLRAQLVAGA
jgi:hypothetical protein